MITYWANLKKTTLKQEVGIVAGAQSHHKHHLWGAGTKNLEFLPEK